MSDFLDHLVTRAQTPATSVQPRLPSRFEPPSAQESMGVDSVLGSAEPNTESVEPNHPSIPASLPRPDIADRLWRLEETLRVFQTGTPVQASGLHAMPETTSRSRQPDYEDKPGGLLTSLSAASFTDPPSEESAIRASEPIRHYGIQSVGQTFPPPPVASPEEVTPRSEGPAPANQPAADRYPVKPRNIEPALDSATSQADRFSKPGPKSDELKVPLEPHPATRLDALDPKTAYIRDQHLIAPLVPSVVPPRARSSMDRVPGLHNAQSVSPPVIHVTIGRVEVRAMSPAPPRARAPTPVPPLIGLEEYLKRRSTGDEK